jgi:hypothetical protein
VSASLESDLASLLTDLLAGQDQLLEILSHKRQLLGAADVEGLAAIAPEEQRLVGVLQDCLERRERLLSRAADDGLPSISVRALTEALPGEQRGKLGRQVDLAGSRTRLLQHQSLVNWVIVQRSLLYLSQLLEIIATGGRLQPTYGEGGRACASGALVDRAA